MASKIALTNEVYDNNDCFDAANSRFTAPYTGLYLFNASIGFTLASSSGYVVSLRVNNTTSYTVLNNQQSSAGGWGNQIGGTRAIYLNAGDYVELFALVTPSAAGISSSTTLEGYLLSR